MHRQQRQCKQLKKQKQQQYIFLNEIGEIIISYFFV